MASTASTRVRAELQGDFENLNTWGARANTAMQRFDDARGQYTIKAITGDVTLTSANFITDEARAAILNFTGTVAATVTVPAVSYWYFVKNDSTANITLKPAGGTGAVIRAGTTVPWVTDGTTGYAFDPTLDKIKTAAADVAMGGFKLTGTGKATSTNDVATLANKVHEFAAPTAALAMNSQKITGLATPTAAADAANKSYVDGVAFNAALPGGSAAGQVAIWNGTTPVWGQVDLADSDARTGTLPVANGGTGLATLTAGSVLVGNGTSAPTLVAPGAAGRPLVSNGAGVAPSFQTFASAGLVFISTQLVGSAVAAVDFTSGIDSTYEEYELRFSNVIPSAISDLWLRTSTNAGSSFDTGANYKRFSVDGSSGASTLSGSNATESRFAVTGNSAAIAVGTGANKRGVSGVLRFSNPAVADLFMCRWDLVFTGSTSEAVLVSGVGLKTTAEDIDALRFLFSTGNITAGRFTLFGVRKV